MFLRRLPSGAFRTVGMEQGRFDVIREVDVQAHVARTLVERDTSTIAFAAWVDGEMQVRDGGRSPAVDYDSFVGFVASVLEQLREGGGIGCIQVVTGDDPQSPSAAQEVDQVLAQ